MGDSVRIRPCSGNPTGQTYDGIFAGTVDIEIFDGCLRPNPAIYIPSLDKVVLGCESWWQKAPDQTINIPSNEVCMEKLWAEYAKLTKKYGAI